MLGFKGCVRFVGFGFRFFAVFCVGCSGSYPTRAPPCFSMAKFQCMGFASVLDPVCFEGLSWIKVDDHIYMYIYIHIDI